MAKNFEEALNNNDASALAALFTEDAVLVNDQVRFTVERLSRNIIRTYSRMCISATMSRHTIRIPLTL